MFGISMWELGVIMVVALILLGPRQLAETARVLGRWYREIQKMSSEIRGAIDLDSVTSSRGSHYDSLPKVPVAPVPPKTEELLPPTGEKTGPDFYAELLESSKEDKDEEVKAEGSKKTEVPGESSESKDKK